MTVRHDALRQQALEVCSTSVTETVAPRQPYDDLGEHLYTCAEKDPTVLADLPAWREGLTPGSQAAATLVAFYRQAVFGLSSRWLAHLVPTTADLSYGPFFGEKNVERHLSGWTAVCPPDFLRWLVPAPDTVFENDNTERCVHREAIRRTRFLHKEMTHDHPWLTPDRLWHDPDWRRLMLDGIRPSSSPRDDETRLLARILGEGMSRLSAAERAAVKADPCFPVWEARWLAVPSTEAAWRGSQLTAPENLPAHPRRRLRS